MPESALTYSRQVKEELAALPLGEPCCRKAETAGFLQAGGSLRLGGGYGLLFVTEYETVAQRLLDLLKSVWGTQPELREHFRRRFDRDASFQIELERSPETTQILLACGWLVPEEDSGYSLGGSVPAQLVRRECCRRAYLRGAFLAAGTIPDPEKGYDIEFVLQSEGYAASLLRLLNRRSGGAHIAERRDNRVVYIREGDKIADLLAAMGATNALFRLEDARIVRTIRAETNRRVNCESANIDKTINAAAHQIEDIQLIESTRGLRSLTPLLREIAETRVEYPDATLQELADLLPGNVSKSAVNHRLRAIAKLAAEIRCASPKNQ